MPWGFIIGVILIYSITYYFIKKDKWLDSPIALTIPCGTLISLLLIVIFLVSWTLIEPNIIYNAPTETIKINEYIVLDSAIAYNTIDNQSNTQSYSSPYCISIGSSNSLNSYIEVYKDCEYASPIASFFFGDSLLPTFYKIYIAGD